MSAVDFARLEHFACCVQHLLSKLGEADSHVVAGIAEEGTVRFRVCGPVADMVGLAIEVARVLPLGFAYELVESGGKGKVGKS